MERIAKVLNVELKDFSEFFHEVTKSRKLDKEKLRMAARLLRTLVR